MDLEPAFLADIVANPHDPTPWLIFADWLEERDDPRGELVRLLRLCWDEPRKKAFAERHARLQEMFAAGVRLPLPRATNSLGMEFVWVPPGRFWKGWIQQRPANKFTTRMSEPFWMAVYPATQGEWLAVTGNNPSYFSRRGGGAGQVKNVSDADLARFPVERVSYSETLAFLEALNQRERGSGWFYRLPTENEWEYAARSPVTCKADCQFSFYFESPTNTIGFRDANILSRTGTPAERGGPNRTTRVGSYRPNRLGIHDLHGNVLEWLDGGVVNSRLIRGGTYWAEARRSQVGFPDRIPGETHRDDLGFRVVRVPLTETAPV